MIHLNFLYTAVSWVLLRWHDLFTAIGLDQSSGLNWVLSIVFLVITARLLLFRLFIKQVHYQRHMQEMQPKISVLRDKYKNDKAEMQRQMMKLQQDEGFNPLSGCLPMVLQIPVFIGLYHVLKHLSNSVGLCPPGNPPAARLTLYTFNAQQTCSAAQAKLFGAPLAASFRDSSATIHALGGDPTTTRWVILVLLLVSASATFGTQLLARANATVTPEGTAATLQRAMLYLIPLGVMASGLLFTFFLGVLLYWFTSNLWTLGQQGYIIRFHPPDQKNTPDSGELSKKPVDKPKPGARPQREKTSLIKTVDAEDSGSPPAAPARSSAPRPGQRPSRGGANRPQPKRPTQSKKRR